MEDLLITCFSRALSATCRGEKPVNAAKLNRRAVKCGYIIHPDCCTRSVSKWLDGVSVNYDATFYKLWSDLLERNLFEVYVDQLLHYATTYGAAFKLGKGYVPNRGGVESIFTDLKVILPITEKELASKCLEMITSDVALGTVTMKAICDQVVSMVREGGFDPDLAVVRNKEARSYLAVKLGRWPEDEFSLLRALVYAYTDSCLLIKSPETIRAIKVRNGREDSDLIAVLKRRVSWEGGVKVNRMRLRKALAEREAFHSPLLDLDEGRLVRLSRIYNRYKPLFLAMKTKATAAVVNRLAKLSKLHHTPLHVGFWESAVSTPHSAEEIAAALPQADNFKKVRILQAINIALKEEWTKAYQIRNGKIYTRQDYEPHYDRSYLELLAGMVRRSLVESLAKKACRVKYPKDFELMAPTSEKSYVGNFPFGTQIRLGQHNVLGIYWRNEWGTRDFDISFTDYEGNRISWCSEYIQGDEEKPLVIYSGDMTNADPEATELLYINGECPDGIVRVNKFYGEANSRFRFFVANERIQDPLDMRNHMVDPNGVRLSTMVEAGAAVAEKAVGLVHDGMLTLMDFSTGAGRVARSRRTIRALISTLAGRTDTFVRLRDLLEEAGFVEDDVDPEVDLTRLERGTLLKLIE